VAIPDNKLAGVLLAAGGATRFGRPKQLCEWQGKALVSYALDATRAVCGAGVVVVTGATATQVAECLQGSSVEIVHNSGWATGMASSLRHGIAAIDQAAVTGVLISLCDQPLISADDLAMLTAAWQAQPERIAAAAYSDTVGVPAIFPVALLDELTALQGDEGARKLLRDHTDISIVAMPAAGLDIDTPEDLARLQESGDTPE
jgi:molybdenum cofactor cytidylyltransferase